MTLLLLVGLNAPPGNASPTATITAPATGGSVVSGTNIHFTGTGSDAEDGALTGASLVWTSSLDGALGTGTSINVPTLSIGVHTITLTATDFLGATGTDSITVTITYLTGPVFALVGAVDVIDLPLSVDVIE